MLPPFQTVPKQLALSLGPPPPVKRQPPAAEEQLDKEELANEALGVGELPGDMSGGGTLTSAVLAQSQALVALVNQMSASVGDPLLDVPASQSLLGEGLSESGPFARGARGQERGFCHQSSGKHGPSNGPHGASGRGPGELHEGMKGQRGDTPWH